MQLLFVEGVFVFFVDESDSLDKVFEVGVASEFSPAFGRALSQLEHHRQRCFGRTAASGLSLAKPDGGERAFNRICRSDVAPVFCREVVEREQFITVF